MAQDTESIFPDSFVQATRRIRVEPEEPEPVAPQELEQRGAVLPPTLEAAATTVPMPQAFLTALGRPPPPPRWVGRQLSQDTMYTLPGGKEYLDLAARQAAGREGFLEAVTPSLEDIPYAGPAMRTVDTARLIPIAKAIADGQDVSDQDLLALNTFLLHNERDSNQTVGGVVGSFMRGGFTFGAELGLAGLLASTVYGAPEAGTALGESLLAKGAAKVTGREVYKIASQTARKALERYMTGSKIPQSVQKFALGGAERVAMFGVAGGVNTAVNQAVQGIASAAAGEGIGNEQANIRQIYGAIDGNPETYLKSYTLGVMSDFIARGSMFSGEQIAKDIGLVATKLPVVGPYAAGVRDKIAAAASRYVGEDALKAASLTDKTSKLAAMGSAVAAYALEKNVTAETAARTFREMGYNGIVGQMASMRLMGFLHGMFGTEGNEAGLKAAWDSMIPTTDQAMGELIAFTMPQLAVRTLGHMQHSWGSLYDSAQALKRVTNPVEFSFENEVEANTTATKAVDLIATEADYPLHPKNLINWAMDLATVPLGNFDLTRLAFGSLDRYQMAEGRVPFVRKYIEFREQGRKAGLDEAQAVDFAKNETKRLLLRVRQSIPAEDASALKKEWQSYVESGVAEPVRWEGGRPVARLTLASEAAPAPGEIPAALDAKFQGFSDMMKRALQKSGAVLEMDNVSADLYQKVSDVGGITLDEFRKMIGPNATPSERSDAMFMFPGLMSTFGAELAVTDPKALEYFNRAVRPVLSMLADEANPKLIRVGDKLVHPDGRTLRVEAQVSGADGMSLLSTIDANGRRAPYTRAQLLAEGFSRPVSTNLVPKMPLHVVDTIDNFKKSVPDYDWDTLKADMDLRQKENPRLKIVEKRDGVEYYRVARAAHQYGDRMMFAGDASVYHYVHDFFEARRRVAFGTGELSERAKASIDGLKDFVEKQGTPEQKRFVLPWLSSPERQAEFYGMLVTMKGLGYEEYPEHLPGHEASRTLDSKTLDMAFEGNFQRFMDYDVGPILGTGWKKKFVNPYLELRPAKPAEMVAPVSAAQPLEHAKVQAEARKAAAVERPAAVATRMAAGEPAKPVGQAAGEAVSLDELLAKREASRAAAREEAALKAGMSPQAAKDAAEGARKGVRMPPKTEGIVPPPREVVPEEAPSMEDQLLGLADIISGKPAAKKPSPKTQGPIENYMGENIDEVNAGERRRIADEKNANVLIGMLKHKLEKIADVVSEPGLPGQNTLGLLHKMRQEADLLRRRIKEVGGTVPVEYVGELPAKQVAPPAAKPPAPAARPTTLEEFKALGNKGRTALDLTGGKKPPPAYSLSIDDTGVRARMAELFDKSKQDPSRMIGMMFKEFYRDREPTDAEATELMKLYDDFLAGHEAEKKLASKDEEPLSPTEAGINETKTLGTLYTGMTDDALSLYVTPDIKDAVGGGDWGRGDARAKEDYVVREEDIADFEDATQALEDGSLMRGVGADPGAKLSQQLSKFRHITNLIDLQVGIPGQGNRTLYNMVSDPRIADSVWMATSTPEGLEAWANTPSVSASERLVKQAVRVLKPDPAYMRSVVNRYENLHPHAAFEVGFDAADFSKPAGVIIANRYSLASIMRQAVAKSMSSWSPDVWAGFRDRLSAIKSDGSEESLDASRRLLADMTGVPLSYWRFASSKAEADKFIIEQRQKLRKELLEEHAGVTFDEALKAAREGNRELFDAWVGNHMDTVWLDKAGSDRSPIDQLAMKTGGKDSYSPLYEVEDITKPGWHESMWLIQALQPYFESRALKTETGLVTVGSVKVGKRAYEFDRLSASARARVTTEMYRQGYFDLGVFGDKTQGFFVKVNPKLDLPQLHKAYVEYWNKAPKEVQNILVPPEKLAEWRSVLSDKGAFLKAAKSETARLIGAIRSKESEIKKDPKNQLLKNQLNKLKSDLTRSERGEAQARASVAEAEKRYPDALYIDHFRRLIDGDYSNYISAKASLMDNLDKRSGNDVTPGRALNHFEEANGRPIKALLLSNKVLSDMLDGQFLFNGKTFGRAYSHEVGSVSSGYPNPYSIKAQIRGNRPDGTAVLDKMNGVSIESFREQGGTDHGQVYDSIRKLFDDLGVDVIIPAEANEKVGPSREWSKLLDDNGAPLFKPDELKRKAFIRSVPGSNFLVVQDLGGLKFGVGRFPKQALGNLSRMPLADVYPRLRQIQRKGQRQESVWDGENERWVALDPASDNFAAKLPDPKQERDKPLMNWLRNGGSPFSIWQIPRFLQRIASKVKKANETTAFLGGLQVVGAAKSPLVTGLDEAKSVVDGKTYLATPFVAGNVEEVKKGQPIRFGLRYEPYLKLSEPDPKTGKRTVRAFDTHVEAVKYVLANWKHFPDMFRPVLGEGGRRGKGQVAWGKDAEGQDYAPEGSPDIRLNPDGTASAETLVDTDIRDMGKHGWVPGGMLMNMTRVPMEGVFSGVVGRAVVDFPDFANLGMQEEGIRRRAGKDMDGDVDRTQVSESQVYDDSPEGVRNRMLHVQWWDQRNPENKAMLQGHMEEVSSDTKTLAGDHKQRETLLKTPKYINSPEWREYSQTSGQAGQRVLGIAAKGYQGFHLAANVDATMPEPLPVVLGGKIHVLQRSPEDVKFLKSKEGRNTLLAIQDTVGPGFIGPAADDPKNPVLAFAGLDKVRLPWGVVALEFNKRLLDAGRAGKSYEELLKVAHEIKADVMESFTTDPAFVAVASELGKLDGSDPFFQGERKSANKLINDIGFKRVTQEEWNEWRALKAAAAETGEKPNYKKWLYEKHPEIAGLWNLERMARAKQSLSKLTDLEASDNLPQDVAAYLSWKQGTVDTMVEGKHPFPPVLEAPGLQTSPFFAAGRDVWNDLTTAYTRHPLAAGAGQRVLMDARLQIAEDKKDPRSRRIGPFGFNERELEGGARYVTKAIAVKALNDMLPNPEPSFDIERFEALKQKYAGNRFVAALTWDARRGRIRGLEAYQDGFPPSIDSASRADFSKLPLAEQRDLLLHSVLNYGMSDSTRAGGFKALMNVPDVGQSVFWKITEAATQAEQARWMKGTMDPAEVKQHANGMLEEMRLRQRQEEPSGPEYADDAASIDDLIAARGKREAAQGPDLEAVEYDVGEDVVAEPMEVKRALVKPSTAEVGALERGPESVGREESGGGVGPGERGAEVAQAPAPAQKETPVTKPVTTQPVEKPQVVGKEIPGVQEASVAGAMKDVAEAEKLNKPGYSFATDLRDYAWRDAMPRAFPRTRDPNKVPALKKINFSRIYRQFLPVMKSLTAARTPDEARSILEVQRRNPTQGIIPAPLMIRWERTVGEMEVDRNRLPPVERQDITGIDGKRIAQAWKDVQEESTRWTDADEEAWRASRDDAFGNEQTGIAPAGNSIMYDFTANPIHAGMYPTGANALQRAMIDERNKFNRIKTMEAAVGARLRRVYGAKANEDFLRELVTNPDGSVSATGKEIEGLEWTDADRNMVDEYMWALGALAENKDAREAYRRNDVEAARAAIAKQDPPIWWGRKRKDPNGVEVPDLEHLSDFDKRFKASDTYRKLVQAGREPLLDYATALKEHADFLDQIYRETGWSENFINNYLPRHFGLGYPSPELKAAVAKTDSHVNRFPSDPDAVVTHLPEDVYRRDFTSDTPPRPTQDQFNLYESLTKDDLSDIRDKVTLWDMNAMLLRELHDKQVTRVLEQGEAYDVTNAENQRDLATIRKLRTSLRGYKYKEWTAREMARRKPGQTFAEAGLSSHGRMKPRTLNILDLRNEYVRDVFSAGMNRSLIAQFVTTPDYDGKPLVVAVPSHFENNKPLLDQATLQESARRLAASMGQRVREDADPRQILTALTAQLSPKDYELVESRYPSIAKFYVRKGEPLQVMKHLVQEPKKLMIGGYDVLDGLASVAQWSKLQSVGWSLFHAGTVTEAAVEASGAKSFRKSMMNPIELYKASKEWVTQRKMLETSDPGLVQRMGEMEEAGMDTSHLTQLDFDVGRGDRAEQQLEAVKERIKLRWGEKAAEGTETTLRWISGRPFSEWLFGGGKNGSLGYVPRLKVFLMDRLGRQLAEDTGVDYNDPAVRKVIYKDLAGSINMSFGGENWDRFLWATPRMRQLLNIGMFAKGWTHTQWRIAGGGMLTGQIFGDAPTESERAYIAKNWIGRALFTVVGVPALVQAGIYASGAMAGTNQDDDKPFPFMNEVGKQTYIDLTPLARNLPWYQGDPTGKRRAYGRWGKSTWEVVDGWLVEPVDQFARKLSQPAKWVLEQTTGKSPGSDWNLEFSGKGLMGWFQTDEEGVDSFLKSRAGYTLTKFIPMSLLSTWENPDAAVAAFIVPVSKGMSLGSATTKMTELLNTYANDLSWDKIRKNGTMRANLDALAPELIDAVKRNGYDPKKVVDTAKGVVLGRLYREFYDAMDQNNTDRMDLIAKRVLRVGGTIKGLTASMKSKKKQYGQQYTAEEASVIAEAFK